MNGVKSYWVYMLPCSDGSYYIGITNDVERRVAEHNGGLDVHCYTFLRRPVEVVYVAEFGDVDRAIAWEKQLKGWSRKKKHALAQGDWKRIHELARPGHDSRE